jgi:hypothetical protein
MEEKKPYDARNGIRRTILTDDATPDVFHVKHEQDVEPILDGIHRDRELMPHTGHNKLAARIPAVIYEQLQRQGIADDPDLFKAWLNSDEAAPWRVWRGRL